MNKMDFISNLVVGLGEVGQALQIILKCDGYDTKSYGLNKLEKHYDILHICIPYSEEFIETVQNYQQRFTPIHTIIHSSVPIGTSRQCRAVHSPIRGIHPNLEEGIRTFTKYFGGEGAMFCAQLFQSKGIEKIRIATKSEDTEALKLWDTTIYGLNILIEKEIYNFCQKNNLNYDLIYGHANNSYNVGYEELSHPEFKKYTLEHREGPIGGHCIIPNAKLLDSPLAKLLCE